MGPRLFAIPTGVLQHLCKAIGRSDLATRLIMSLEFDVEDSFVALKWRPATETRDGVIRAVGAMNL
jgi:hypothetical protein